MGRLPEMALLQASIVEDGGADHTLRSITVAGSWDRRRARFRATEDTREDIMIPYGRQSICADDIAAVVEVLQSDWLTQGPVVPRFEAALAQVVGAPYAVAVSSGTAALHLACLGLGLKAGDWLWTSPISFVASANCGRYCGARVGFVDIDPLTFNISPAALAEKLRQAERSGCLPRILVVVHLAGSPCDMEAISELARRYRVSVVEDACHALGGRYQDTAIGGCRYADAAVFSFHPVKAIATGEGGMLVTARQELAQRVERLRSHGITRDPGLMTGPADGPWYYQQLELGFNYRMTDLQAALGLSQLARLDRFIQARREKAELYDRAFASLPLGLQRQRAGESARHIYIIRVEAGARLTRDELFERLRAMGIGVNLHYIPIHLQPYYAALGFRAGDFPEAEAYYREAMTLPLYVDLSERQQRTVIEAVTRLLAG
jgi:UDP-4-amino-4,6-dideoxy-N-acetyl-beta-L-altrosamine transaminase